ncbi:hypothetical protein AA309_20955 [Microvirga vignae]|uniref:Uncharacterized protein n=1 Tax=Microvirga vignae TaxID=1225564 RepID=A0A0H1R848_9HYPH|nr:hypothetical protein [Microvirga vignae]KLK91323.1 hypothetical protein AA309_20955 [Microvirga vignae]
MTDLHQQITDLEAEIDHLSDAAEQCRKSMVVAKVVIAAGVAVSGASLFGLIRSDPLVLIIGIAATIAGIGFFGSSRGSLEQIAAKLRAGEMRRAELIDGIDLKAVQGR